MDNEIKIMERGSYYLTPFLQHHIDEFIHVIHPENVRELKILGHNDIRQALEEIISTSEVYLVRDGNDEVIFVGGVFIDDEVPQLFAIFSSKLRDNFTVLARGSRMLMSFFDQTYNILTVSILANHEAMLNWAAWLGFDPVGFSSYKNTDFVEFVRCNPRKKNVSHETSRPVMH